MNSDDLVAGVCAKSPAAIARAISVVERGLASADELIAQLYARSGSAHVVGVTGIPGSGKSTLVTGLAQQLRRQDRTVGIIAVDPSSPYSGGSLMGDRIRMGKLAGDPGVFIRSMATRGSMGGLARATADAVTVLDAAGKDIILIETVGVGQDEVDIASASHTTLVVSLPGTGDDIQAIKAGVLEIADIHVVNKADRPGADRVVAELKEMLRHAGLRNNSDLWNVPVHATVAESGQGTDELIRLIDGHCVWLDASGRRPHRERLMAEARVRSIVHAITRERFDAEIDGGIVGAVLDEVAARHRAPGDAARMLLTRIAG